MSSQGTVLGGRYRLETVIGRGGMAEVWRAHDQRLGRPVAVKRLRVDLASDPTFLARFRREAQSAAGLNHPNIVSVYDTGEALDTSSGMDVPYIVMELVQGHTLREVLRDGRKILPERALQFVQGVLDALAYSHRNGIVHRDIKPANVMLTGNGQVKVMDFGIARAVADTSATMTQTAAVIGTAQYLSPEQARGETVDQRSDIYSAGCLLYELLVGRPPFVGDSPVSVAYQHVREIPVPPSHLDPEITPAMDAITLKALAKNPDDRYQTAQEMSSDIGRLLAGHEVTAVIPPPLVVVPEPAPTAIVPGLAATTTASGVIDPITDTGTVVTQPRKRSAGSTILWVLVALLLVALGFGAYQILKGGSPEKPAQTQVPRVIGYNEENAKSAIVNAKLAVGEVTYTNGEDATKGTVIDQTPQGLDMVDVGTKVNLKVNIGVKTAKVPEGLIGKSEAEATKILTDAKFKVERKDASAEDGAKFNKGQVVSTNPSGGADQPEGATVELFVATGMVKVPDGLVGKTEKEATELLTSAGFKVKSSQVDGGTKGQVSATDPSSGTQYAKGQTVTISIGKGNPVIPDGLVGQQADAVTATLTKAGFKVKTQEASQPEPVKSVAGEVLSVDPPSGSDAQQGQTVTITVASGKSVVPNLRGKTVDEATAIAKNLGFTLEVTEKETTQSEAGKVFEQSPNDGETLTRGESIKVTVAKAPVASPSQSVSPTP